MLLAPRWLNNLQATDNRGDAFLRIRFRRSVTNTGIRIWRTLLVEVILHARHLVWKLNCEGTNSIGTPGVWRHLDGWDFYVHIWCDGLVGWDGVEVCHIVDLCWHLVGSTAQVHHLGVHGGYVPIHVLLVVCMWILVVGVGRDLVHHHPVSGHGTRIWWVWHGVKRLAEHVLL